jgi:hypothetical protein
MLGVIKMITKKKIGIFLFSLLSIFIIFLFIDILFCKLEERKENRYFVDKGEVIFVSTKMGTSFEVLHNIGQQMEVFPIEVWTRWRDFFKLSFSTGMKSWEPNQYSLTFEQYHLLYELREQVYMMSKKELSDCIAKMDEATPKEKALILTTIFLFERTHRRKPRSIKYKITTPILPYYKVHYQITTQQWQNWVAIIEKYKDSQELTFPTLTIDKTILLKCTENGITYNLFNSLSEENDLNRRKQVRSEPINSFTSIPFLEYLYAAKMNPFPEDVVSEYHAIPKTLGDIATQLLMSRLPYEGNNE